MRGFLLALPASSLALVLLQAPTTSFASVAATAAVPSAPPKAPRAVRTRPLWSELSTPQHQALAPLAAHWDVLSDTQKRKWLVVSRNFQEMPSSEQTKLHDRMNEWITLSPQQRRTARFNFAETNRLSGDEKQKQWEAYQALSPDDRRKFSDFAAPGAPGAAAAVKPVSRQKLTPVASQPDRASRPRLAGPSQIDPHTLLPKHGTASTPSAPQPSDR